MARTGRSVMASLVTGRIASLGKYLPGQTVLVAARWAWVSHPALRDVVALAEVGDQGLGRGDLTRRRRLLVEIAHQADADPVFVDVVSAGVATVNTLLLVGPALGDLDLAVAAAGAVADHEVVAAAVEAEDLAMLAVDLVVVAAGRGTVMEDDVLPGPVGLVGIDELIGARVIDKRPEALAQAGAANPP